VASGYWHQLLLDRVWQAMEYWRARETIRGKGVEGAMACPSLPILEAVARNCFAVPLVNVRIEVCAVS